MFKFLSPERTPGTSVPTCVVSLSVMVRKADRLEIDLMTPKIALVFVVRDVEGGESS
jgi:hypothetical protein